MSLESRPAPMPAPPGDDPGDPALIAILRAEIEGSGPITFDQFMQRALYEPGLGYYATTDSRPTRSGDYLTAPELHPIFGYAVARQIDEMRERLGDPADFTIREYGAGGGALERSIHEGLSRRGESVAAYEAVEVEGRTAPSTANGVFTGVVLANEFLDALPVHRVLQTGGRLRELYIDWHDGRFIEVVGDPSDGRLAESFETRGLKLSEGQRAEVNLGIDRWLTEVQRDLARGYVLLIDYGLPQAELHSEVRANGTIRAFRAHHVSSDVLSVVGHQDITATVDLDALEAAAQGVGFVVAGRTTQAEFLMSCGFEGLYEAERARADQDWGLAGELRSAVRRLLDPRGMGGFAVVILAKGAPTDPPLRGLSYSMPRRHG